MGQACAAPVLQQGQFRYQIVLLGDYGCGKTSFQYHFTHGTKFSEGIELQPEEMKTLTMSEGCHVTFEFKETQQQERAFKAGDDYWKRFCINAQCVVCCFDLTVEDALDKVKPWVTAAQKLGAFVVLVGCKSDLKRKVQAKDAKQFATECAIEYSEVSGATGDGVEATFKGIAMGLLKLLG